MVIYFFIALIILLLSLDKSSQFKLLFCVIILTIFSALRFQVGTDFNTYYLVSSGKINILENNYMLFEPFNIFLISIGYKLGSSQFYFIATAIITHLFIYKFIKKYSSNYALSIIFYFGFPFLYLESFNIVRQFVAIAIVLMSIEYVMEKKFFMFIAVIIIATFFHVSAIFGLSFYLINLFPFGRNKNFIYLIFSLIAGKIMISILLLIPYFYKINYYLSHNEGGYFFVTVVLGVTCLLNLLLYDRLTGQDSRNKFFIDLYNIGFCLYLLFLSIPVFAGRISFYFLILLVIIIPMYYEVIKERFFIKYSICTLFFLLFFYRIYFSSQLYKAGIMPNDPYIPYTIYFLN